MHYLVHLLSQLPSEIRVDFALSLARFVVCAVSVSLIFRLH